MVLRTGEGGLIKEFSRLPIYLEKLFFWDAWKWLAAVAMSGAQFLFPTDSMKSMAAWALLLVFLDTLTGFVASLITGQAISSARFMRVLVKILGYGVVVLVVAGNGKYIGAAAEMANLSVTSVLTLVIFTESISILENVRKFGIKLPFGIDAALQGRLDKAADSLSADPTSTKDGATS